MLDARVFLEAERRRILHITAIALTIASGCLALVMSLAFLLVASQGAGIIALAGVFGLIGMSMTWVLIARAPLWLAVLPMLVALLLSAILVTLLLPELGLIALVCLLLAISISTLSNSRRLTLSVALVGGLLSIVLTVVVLPIDWMFSLGAALPIIYTLVIVIVTSSAAMLAERFIASQNAALALAEAALAQAEAARDEAEAARAEIERLHGIEQQLNAQLATYNRTLEQQVAARTAELQNALTAVQGVNVRLEGLLNFARFMQHEIRGYAAGLEGLIPLLRQGFETHPQAAHYLTRLEGVEETVAEMNDLTQRVLILTREGTLPLAQQQVVALLPLLEQVRRKTLDFAQHLDFALDVRLEVAPDLMVLGDALYVALACYTGLRNAVEVLSAQDRDDAMVTVAAQAEAQHVQLQLSDNGPGFPSALLEAIAVARQSAGGFVIGWSSKRGGSGLGLALMERVAQLHSGSLAIGNRTDQPGAWIKLTLPQAELATSV